MYVYLLVNLFSMQDLGCLAQLLPPQEVQTLEAIATKLKIKHWDVKRSSCSGGGGLSVVFDIPQPLSNVTYDCSFSNNSVCHVTHIQLKRLNLMGELPSKFSKLAYLQEMLPQRKVKRPVLSQIMI